MAFKHIFQNIFQRKISKKKFLCTIPKNASILEIGPFYNPVCKGENVKYFDIINREDLIRRAKSINSKIEESSVPFIDFVSPTGDLAIINETFDIVISSHAIEHQLDLIDHLQKTSNLLKKNGKYYAIIPDKRFCFDYYNNETTIADVINSNCYKQTKHSLKSVIEHRALTTHNSAKKHWIGIHGSLNNTVNRIKEAIEEYNQSDYVDVHAWCFTPNSFTKIINLLYELGYIDFKIKTLYHTSVKKLEFYVVLEKCES